MDAKTLEALQGEVESLAEQLAAMGAS